MIRKVPFLTGAFTPLVTPFKSGAVDYDRYAQLIEWQIEQGTPGLLVHAPGGEPTTLTLDAQDNQKNRGPDSDLLVGREAPDDECSQRHDHHCDHQHDLTANPIAEMAEDGPTDRTCNESYR